MSLPDPDTSLELDGAGLRALVEVALLAGHFADRARRRLGTGPIRLTAEALAELARGAWPGNVGELENAVSRGIVRASGRVALGEPVLVQRSDVSVDGATPSPAEEPAPAAPLAGRTLHEAVQDYRRELIQAALRRADGNGSAAARELGMHRSNLHHLAARLGLR